MPIGRQIRIVEFTSGTITAGGTSPPSGTPVDIESGHPLIVAIVDPASGGSGLVRLPSGAQIGDTVEVYTSSGTAYVFAPESEDYLTSPGGAPVVSGNGMLFRKISETKWVFI